MKNALPRKLRVSTVQARNLTERTLPGSAANTAPSSLGPLLTSATMASPSPQPETYAFNLEKVSEPPKAEELLPELTIAGIQAGTRVFFWNPSSQVVRGFVRSTFRAVDVRGIPVLSHDSIFYFHRAPPCSRSTLTAPGHGDEASTCRKPYRFYDVQPAHYFGLVRQV